MKPHAPKDTADPIVELQRQALAQATEEHSKQLILLRAQADADALEKSSAIASLTEKLQVDPLPSPLLFQCSYFLSHQSANSDLDAAKQRISVLESDLSTASQNYTNAIAESASVSSSTSEQITKLRSDLAAAKTAQKSAEASINDLKVRFCLTSLVPSLPHSSLLPRRNWKAKPPKLNL